MKNVLKIAAVGAALLGASTVAANAGITKQPGETSGIALGATLPEGVYFVNTLSWGQLNVKNGPDARVLVDVPVIAWSTGWNFAGINLTLVGALPNIHADRPGAIDNYGLYNPFAGALLNYDFGNGFGVGYLSGIYFNTGDKDIRVRATTWRQDFAASYTGDGWNLTANLTWGITFDTDNSAGGKTSNGLGLDLTATKTFGKWEVGAVGFGSTEYDLPAGQSRKNKQFAVGPLVGYNFGPLVLQAYLTRDIYARQAGGSKDKETRFWTRVVIPLWSPTPAAAPMVTKY